MSRSPLARAEAVALSLSGVMDLALVVPDHTTFSRRANILKVCLRLPRKLGRTDLVIGGQRLTDASVGAGNIGVEERFCKLTGVDAAVVKMPRRKNPSNSHGQHRGM